MSGILSRRALFARAVGAPHTEPPKVDGPMIAVVGGGCFALRGIACSVCSDPCEPGALRVRPMLGGKAVPVIDSAACTGCGDCLKVCPADALTLTPAAAVGEEGACA